MTTKTRSEGEMAFFQAVSTPMGTLGPRQVKAKVALLRHAHQALQGPQALEIQGGPERAKLGKTAPQDQEKGKTKAKDDKRSQDRPTIDCCVHQDNKHNNQSQKGVARQGNLCQNFKIGKVPPSRPSPPKTTPQGRQGGRPRLALRSARGRPTQGPSLGPGPTHLGPAHQARARGMERAQCLSASLAA